MLVLVGFALRFVQSCVFGALVMTWLGADPKHPAVQATRAVAEPFLALARPLARKVPLPVEWTATTIVLTAVDILRRVIGA